MSYILKIRINNKDNKNKPSSTIISVSKNNNLTSATSIHTCNCGVRYNKPVQNNNNCVLTYLLDTNFELDIERLNKEYKITKTSEIFNFALKFIADRNITKINCLTHQIYYSISLFIQSKLEHNITFDVEFNCILPGL